MLGSIAVGYENMRQQTKMMLDMIHIVMDNFNYLVTI